jgi:transposase/DNA-binding transcriptional MerR regulator
MAFREVGMFEVREVIRLFSEGVPKKAIARVVGVDPKTVRSYVAAAEALGLAGVLDDDGLARLLQELRIDVTERPHGEAWRRCEENRDVIQKCLDKHVRLTKVRKLLERRDVFVPYPTLHRFAAEELGFGRRRHSVLVVDPPAGAELQVDTGFVWRLGGTRKKAFVFTPTLSRYRFVYVVERETTEAAIEACEAAWAFYGGIFKALVPDNTKAIVDVASPTTPRIVEAFLEYAQARGFAVDPARVRRPQDKGRVERSVQFVRDDCFGGEDHILSRDDAQRRAMVWTTTEMGLRVHATTQKRPREHFEGEEKGALLPLPETPWDTPVWHDVTVDKTQHVVVDRAFYMLPEKLIGRTLRARRDKQTVRFYDRGVVVKVLPTVARGQRSFDEADIPAHKRAYALRDEGFLVEQAREHSDVVGAFAEALCTGPAAWTRMRRVSALLSLVKRFGVARVDAAARRALDADMHDVDRLRRMLEAPVVDGGTPLARVLPLARHLRPPATWATKPRTPEGETR